MIGKIQKDRVPLKHELISEAKVLLKDLKNGHISASAYDTAWVALIPEVQNISIPMFPECLEWILQNQNADGSWGVNNIEYYHDRIISTLSCIITLKTWNKNSRRINAGESYINKNLANLRSEFHETVGFELIFPPLLEKAERLGIKLDFANKIISEIRQNRNDKLKRIPLELIYEIPTTILHSLEGLDDEIDWKEILKHQSKNGSFLNSPSSTVCVYLKTFDKKSLKYIRSLMSQFNSFVPVNYPIDIFEKLWVLNEVYTLGLQDLFKDEVKNLNDYIKEHWTDKGISWSKDVVIPDLDDTAVAFKLLNRIGEHVSSDVFYNFFDGEKFFCFKGERRASSSHILSVLEAAEYFHENINLIFSGNHYIEKNCNSFSSYSDKWNLSPFYILQKKINVSGGNVAELQSSIEILRDTINTKGIEELDVKNILLSYAHLYSKDKTLLCQEDYSNLRRMLDYNGYTPKALWIDKSLYALDKVDSLVFLKLFFIDIL